MKNICQGDPLKSYNINFDNIAKSNYNSNLQKKKITKTKN